MNEMKAIMENYGITEADITTIQSFSTFMSGNIDELTKLHYEKLLSDEETARFIRNKETMERAKNAFVDWFYDLISGEYNDVYLKKLNRTGKTHVRIGLPCHYVNVQMSLVRDFVAQVIIKEYGNEPGKPSRLLASINKAIDMNLDVMTRSYREAERDAAFLTSRIDNMIIATTKRLVTGFNFALMVGLLLIGVTTLALSVNDMAHLISGDLERGVLAALGSLLILWVIIELLDTQIRHMRGSVFAIKVFVSVALVAELRRVLITSIEHGSWQAEAILAGSILVLGFIYWLISLTEKR